MGWSTNKGGGGIGSGGGGSGSTTQVNGPLDLNGQPLEDTKGPVTLPSDETFAFSGRARFSSPADGTLTLTSTAGSLAALQLGGVGASYPMLKRNAAAVALRLADDSADANLTAGQLGLSGTLSAAGAATLAATSVTTLSASGAALVGGTLGVTGASTLAAVSATSLNTSGNAAVGGTLGVTGASTLAATSATTLSTSGAATLASASVTGTLSVGGAATLAAVSATSLAASGNATIGGTLGVTGACTLAAVSATTLSTSGAATFANAGITGNATIGGTLGVTGASTLASAAVTGNATVGGTLGVTGASTLAGLSAGATTLTTLSTSGLATLNSASITNNATVGGNLTITGNVTITGTLTTTGADTETNGTFNSLTVGAGTAASPSLVVGSSAGFYQAAAGQLDLSIGGSGIVTVDTQDKAGMATSQGIAITLLGTFSDASSPLLRFGSVAGLLGYPGGITVRDGLGTTNGNLTANTVYASGRTGALNDGIIAGYGGLVAYTGCNIRWASSSRLTDISDGIIQITNNAGTGFGQLRLGGSTASFPMLKVNGAALALRLANDSADAAFSAGAATLGATSATTLTSSGLATLASASITGNAAVGGVLTLPAGTASAPSLAVGTSAGLYQPSAKQLATSLNGAQVEQWDAQDKGGGSTVNGSSLTLLGSYFDGVSSLLRMGATGGALLGYAGTIRVRDNTGTLDGTLYAAFITATSVNDGTNQDGIQAISGNVMAAPLKSFRFNASSRITDLGDGVLALTNNAASSFGRLVFGPAASTSWPALKPSSAQLQVRLADDSGFANFAAATAALSNITMGGQSVFENDGASVYMRPINASGGFFIYTGGAVGSAGTNRLSISAAGNVTMTGNLGVSGNISLGGTFTLANGTAAAPSQNFAGATTTGLWYDTTNTAISMTLGGTQRHLFTALNVLSGGSTYGALQFVSGGAYLSCQSGVSGRIAAVAAANNAYAGIVSGGFIVGSNLNGALTDTGGVTGISLSGGNAQIYAGSGKTVSATLNAINGWQLSGSAQMSAVQWLVQPKTANYTITQADSGTTITNGGATGSVVATLPTAPIQGTTLYFFKVANQSFSVAVGSGDIIYTAAGSSLTTVTLNSQYGSLVLRYASSGVWVIVSQVGTSAAVTDSGALATTSFTWEGFVASNASQGSRKALLFTDFMQTSDLNPYYTGGSVSTTHQFLTNVYTGMVGTNYTQLSTTTGSTNASHIVYNYNCLPGRFRRIRNRIEFFLPQLSNSTDTFTAHAGMCVTGGNRKILSVAYSHALNSGNLLLYYNNGGASMDTGVTVAINTVYAFEFFIDVTTPGTSSANPFTAYVYDLTNNVTYGPFTGNTICCATTGNSLDTGMCSGVIVKSAGTTACLLNITYISIFGQAY